MTTDLTTRYANAEALLPHHLKKLILRAQVQPSWILDTDTFWYCTSTASGREFVLVDAAAGTRQPAFDHARLAESLGRTLGESFDPESLPFLSIEVIDGAVRFVVEEQRIELSLDSYAATIIGPAHASESRSPDGRWSVGIRDHDLHLRDTTTGEERQLTTDGSASYSYATTPDSSASKVMQENVGFTTPPLIVWSPDSTRFVTHRLDQRDVELMHLVRSTPPDGARPTVMSCHYATVGDEHLPTADFFVFDAATGDATQTKGEPLLIEYVSPIALGFVWWSADSEAIYRMSSDRGGLVSRVEKLDPGTGEISVLAEESNDFQVMYGPQLYDRNVRVLASGEVLWWSERSGWGHLYLYAADGTVSTLTSGDWLVRKVVTVDEDERRVVFTAAGRIPGSDLYLQELYSVSLDGGEITIITSNGLDHDARPAPSDRFFVDVTSRADVPTVSVLRDASGEIVLGLEEADASALYAAGWAPPERVVVKAADGVTDLYCAIYLPHEFDPEASYPVLDEIYPGPQVSTTPLRFPVSGGPLTAERSGAIFAALGFAVVAVDARGTALRHRTFQDHARLGHHGEFVDDHVAAIKQLAQTRPWMDLERVGIFGHSGGGYASTRSILQAPDFFKVAVSSAGDHENRTYHAWWGERFYGLDGEFDFDEHANVTRAHRLQGKLLLAHGEMDDNVTPHLTMRLVDALIEANKDFDLLIVPNADHTLLHRQEYWVKRRWDYFVEHLLGETPPTYRIADIPLDAEALAALTGV